MKVLAAETYRCLHAAVMGAIKDVRREAFKLVTGKPPGVPFLFRVAAQSQVSDCVTVEGPY